MERNYKTSIHTKTKDDHLYQILKTHMTIVKSIIKRYEWPDKRYYYWDLTAGPGIDKNGRKGSPVIFLELINKIGFDYFAWLYEKDIRIFEMLQNNIQDPKIKLLYGNHYETLPYCYKMRNKKYGLIYSDTSGNIPPFDLLGEFTSLYAFNRIDVLIYVSSANIKRGLGHKNNTTVKRLNEYISLINKKFWIVREPLGKQQWTFLIGTNWTNFPVFESIGFHRTDSIIGKEIMYKLCHTAEERKKEKN